VQKSLRTTAVDYTAAALSDGSIGNFISAVAN